MYVIGMNLVKLSEYQISLIIEKRPFSAEPYSSIAAVICNAGQFKLGA